MISLKSHPTAHVGEDEEQEEHSSIAGGRANLNSHFGSQCGWFLRKLGINLPQDPAIALLGIYPKDTQSHYKDISSTMFIAALFVIARTWKQ